MPIMLPIVSFLKICSVKLCTFRLYTKNRVLLDSHKTTKFYQMSLSFQEHLKFDFASDLLVFSRALKIWLCKLLFACTVRQLTTPMRGNFSVRMFWFVPWEHSLCLQSLIGLYFNLLACLVDRKKSLLHAYSRYIWELWKDKQAHIHFANINKYT